MTSPISDTSTQPPLCFFFVVDGAGLESYSYLLASSLRKHHPNSARHKIKAFVSQRTLPELSAQTRALYDMCEVEIVPLLADDVEWRGEYLHGNKIIAAAACDDEHAVFLDTDMVCVNPIDFGGLDPATQFAAAPEGRPTWGKPKDHWPRAYAHFDLSVPEERIRLTRGRRREYPPYFNAGFVYFKNIISGNGRRFGEEWLHMALDFDWTCPIANKRPWLDQITLPLLVAKHKLRYEVLPESYNFSASKRSPLELPTDCRIIHYHRPRYLMDFDVVPALVQDLLSHFRPEEHAYVRERISAAGFEKLSEQ